LWALVALVLVEGGKRTRKGADYYATLGVEENADKDAIKKAYRAKSLEYHPDKCATEKDECQTKFIEVSTAYEILSDPEKRKVYNEHGEEGLKEEGGQSGEQARQMFRQFFGREPDGNVRIINRGGQMQFMEEGEPGPKENIYDDTSVMEMTSDVWKAYITDRDAPWVVQFYKPNDDDSVEAKPEFIKFGDTFKEFLNVAAVNCRQQRDICSGASINNYPAVRWFTEDPQKDPEVFEGLLTSKLLGKWANSLMPDFTTIIEDKHKLRQWLDSAAKGPTVLLFTDKSTPPPMWKALSREFKGRANLGVVPRCDKSGVFKTPLQREFDVYIPQIVHIDPMAELGKIAEKYSSQIKKDVLNLWLMKLIALGKRAGPVATFKEWTTERYTAGECAPTDGQFCFLWLKAGADASTEEATKQLAHKYRTDPIKMMWANVELSPSLLEAFGLENSDASDHFVAFRPKRGRFKVHEGTFKFPELDAFVDGVMNGGPMTGKMANVEL